MDGTTKSLSYEKHFMNKVVLYLLPVVLCLIIVLGVYFYGWSLVFEGISMFTMVFLSIFIEAAPFLLAGALGSALVEVFFTHTDISRWLPKHPVAGALSGVLLGFFFPVCECGVVPFTRRLFQKGLPLPVGISFLLAAPALNPIVLAGTLTAFGWGEVFWGRLSLTIIIAGVTGVIFGLQTDIQEIFNPNTLDFLKRDSPLCLMGTESKDWKQKIQHILNITADEFFDTGRFLVAGAALASLLQTLIPQSLLLNISQGQVISVFILLALAVLLSVCSTVDAFIALSFAGSFTTGSLLAFLVFGPMVDIKSTMMFLQVFRRRTVIYLILIPMSLMIMAALFINLNMSW